MSTTYTDTEPWKRQPACNICNLQHAGYEKAHTETDDAKDYSANFPHCQKCGEAVLPYMHADCVQPCSLSGYCSTCATRDGAELEFEAWWAQEVELTTPTLRDCAAPIHSIALSAFRQGLAIGREGRA